MAMIWLSLSFSLLPPPRFAESVGRTESVGTNVSVAVPLIVLVGTASEVVRVGVIVGSADVDVDVAASSARLVVGRDVVEVRAADRVWSRSLF
jgi:hypothetical protein